MFLNYKVFRFSVKLRKVFVVFCRKVMKDMRQEKRHIPVLGTGRNRSMWTGYDLRHDIVRFTRVLMSVRGFRIMVLIKSKRT